MSAGNAAARSAVERNCGSILGQITSKDKDKPTQWHPLFAELLRPLLQDYYEVQVNVPVGDLPREADILLLRRTGEGPTPFRGLWRHLTTWNILEFKGSTENPRLPDLSLLVELGLGMDRRLNYERRRQRQKPLPPEQTSFWYIVRKIGGPFLTRARRTFGQIEEIETGLWRSHVLQHLVFLVSSETFASEPDSVPLHLLVQRPPKQERELAHLVLEHPGFWHWYGRWLSFLHPETLKELREMVRKFPKEFKIDYDFIAENMDMADFAEKMGMQRILEIFGPKKVSNWLLEHLTPEERKKLKERLK